MEERRRKVWLEAHQQVCWSCCSPLLLFLFLLPQQKRSGRRRRGLIFLQSLSWGLDVSGETSGTSFFLLLLPPLFFFFLVVAAAQHRFLSDCVFSVRVAFPTD